MRAGDESRIGATGDHRDCADEGSASADDPNQPVYVFGTKIGTPDGARNLTPGWVTLAERQGIRRVPLHGLRHSCVSLLLAQGVHPRTVMEIVGHSAIEMTINVYTKARELHQMGVKLPVTLRVGMFEG